MPDKQWLLGPQNNLVELLAQSATFQTMVGAADATEAKGSIYLGEAADDGSQPMPRAIVGSTGGRQLEKRSTSGWVGSGGGLFVMLERKTPDDQIGDPNAAYKDFGETVEAIVDDMKALAGTDAWLNVQRFTEITPPMEGDPDLNQGTPFWFSVIGAEPQG